MSRLGDLIPRLGEPAGSVRQRLIALAVAPLVLVLPILLTILAIWGGRYFNELLITKIRSDLAIAESYYQRVTESVGRSVDGLANSARLARALAAGERWRTLDVKDLIGPVDLETHFDFLLLLSPEQAQRDLKRWPVLESALAGLAQTHTEVFSAEDLADIDPALAVRAQTPIIQTLNAAETERHTESSGLMILTAAPVRNGLGEIVGVLMGGVLLNKNLRFIDALNAIVYPSGALPSGSSGTATLFLGDVRVATNVRLFENTRAIGTRVSEAVRQGVLDRGETWLGRAFVVTDWYVSGYKALLNGRNERIGMIYVGFLEKPYATARLWALGVTAMLFGAGTAAAVALAIAWARRISQPIERMQATVMAIENGQNEARVGPVNTDDELGSLAQHLDNMLDELQAQAQSLKRWGESLDRKVAERTVSLEQAINDLTAANTQLVRSEKLAAIGQLTAGIAHEINNPLAVIQGNLDVLQDVLGDATQPVANEIKLIHDQVQRIRLIVAQLLQFTRPKDFVGFWEQAHPAELVRDCVPLINHLLKTHRVLFQLRAKSHRTIHCNRNEIQQVLINLLVNAVQAMPDGGALTVDIDDWDEFDMPFGVKVIVDDEGPGIIEGDLENLFKPFFTAKKPGGNGLGLWVSQNIVQRYGGKLTAESRKDGARFIAWLRSEPLE